MVPHLSSSPHSRKVTVKDVTIDASSTVSEAHWLKQRPDTLHYTIAAREKCDLGFERRAERSTYARVVIAAR